MNMKELKLLVTFLDRLRDDMGNASCNDWEFPPDWSPEERRRFVKQFHDYNGDPEEYDPNHLRLADFCVVGLLQAKLKYMIGPDTHEFGCPKDGEPKTGICEDCDRALRDLHPH